MPMVAALRRLCDAAAEAGDARWLVTLRELLELLHGAAHPYDGKEATTASMDSEMAAGAEVDPLQHVGLEFPKPGSRPSPNSEDAWGDSETGLTGQSSACAPCPSSEAMAEAAAMSLAAAAGTWDAEASGGYAEPGRLPARLLAALAGTRPPPAGPPRGRQGRGGDA